MTQRLDNSVMDPGQLLGYVIVAALGIVGTVITSRILEKRTDLTYRVHSSGDLVPTNSKVPLQILYQSVPVDHLVQLRVEFTNRGSVPVQSVKVSWILETSGTEVELTVSDESILSAAGYVDNSGTEQRNAVIIHLLNPGESAYFEILIADDPKPALVAKARGVGVVARVETPSRLRPSAAWIGILAGFLASIIFSLALLDQIETIIRGYGIAAIFFLSISAVLIYGVCLMAAVTFFDRRR
jgi:hypothetical protein